jgi:putative transposase
MAGEHRCPRGTESARSQAHAIVACDFFTATTLTGATYYVFAVIEHAGRRVRILGVTVHPVGWTVTPRR